MVVEQIMLDELMAHGYTITIHPNGYEVFKDGEFRWALHCSHRLPEEKMYEQAIGKCREAVRKEFAVKPRKNIRRGPRRIRA